MLKTLTIILLFLFSLGSKAQESHTHFYDKVKDDIFSKIIPKLLSVSGENLKKTIENTKVNVINGGNLNDAYAINTDQGPEIVMGSNFLYFLYLHASGQLGISYIAKMNDYEGVVGTDLVSYQNYLFVHLREQIDKNNSGVEIDAVPDTIYEYLGISEVNYKNAIIANGGLDFYDQILSDYFIEAIASILAHEYAHVHYRHIYVKTKDITKYALREQEWKADQLGILLLANSVGVPSGAILGHQVMAIIENPEIPTNHPSSICRLIYTLDAVIYFAWVDFELKKDQGLSKELLDALKKSIEVLESFYVNKKKDILVSNICDDFVYLHY